MDWDALTSQVMLSLGMDDDDLVIMLLIACAVALLAAWFVSVFG